MKKQDIIRLCLLILLVSFGCASPINRHTGSRYYREALRAESRGDYEAARMFASRAYGNARMGNLGPVAEAYSLYELARFSGYTGSYAEAERQFREVLVLIDAAEGKANDLRAPTLSELARLLHDTDQHAKAIPVFRDAVAELEQLGIVHKDPTGFADFLSDYAHSARAANDEALAVEMKDRVKIIRERNPDMRAQTTFKRYR